MSRDASGTYTQPAGTEAVTGQVIDADTFNALIEDMSTALSQSLDREGRGAMLADLAMGAHKLTGVSPGVADTDGANLGQLKNNFAFTNIEAVSMDINGPPGTERKLSFRSNTVDRFLLLLSNAAESGGNVGSDVLFSTVADDGATRLIPMRITRSTAVVDFLFPPTVAGLPIIPLGSIFTFPSIVAPPGFLACSGQLISRVTFANLWTFANASGNIVSDATWTGGAGLWDGSFSSGDGSTTFRLPDARGNFQRSWDNGRGVDPARAIGTMQTDQLQDHIHNSKVTVGFNLAAGTAPYLDSGGASNFGTSNPVTGNHGTETRPRNVAWLTCIKY